MRGKREIILTATSQAVLNTSFLNLQELPSLVPVAAPEKWERATESHSLSQSDVLKDGSNAEKTRLSTSCTDCHTDLALTTIPIF